MRDLTAAISDAEPRVRKDRRQGRRRIPPAQRQRAADRERVLQLHPAQAHHAERRAADAGAAAGGRAVRRNALARRLRSFDPVGVNQNKLRFLEAFAAFCVLRDNAVDRDLGAGRTRRQPRHRRTRRASSPACCCTRDGRQRVACATGRSKSSIRCRASASCSTKATRSAPIRRRSKCRTKKIRDLELTPAARTCTNCARTTSRSSTSRCACRRCTSRTSATCSRPNAAAPGGIPARSGRSRSWRSRGSRPADRLSFDEYLEQYFFNTDTALAFRLLSAHNRLTLPTVREPSLRRQAVATRHRRVSASAQLQTHVEASHSSRRSVNGSGALQARATSSAME